MSEQIFSPLPDPKDVKAKDASPAEVESKSEERSGELGAKREANDNSLEKVNEWRLKELTAVADAMVKGDRDFRLEPTEIDPGFFDLGKGELVDIRKEVIEVKRKLIDVMLGKYWDALEQESDIDEKKNEVVRKVEEYAEFLYQPKQYATPSEVSEAGRERKAALAKFNEHLEGPAGEEKKEESQTEANQDEAMAA